MPLVRLQPKRQLTIPEELADRLHIQAGDYLEATVEGPDRLVFLVKERQDRNSESGLPARLGSAKGAFSSVDEIDAYIANGRAD